MLPYFCRMTIIGHILICILLVPYAAETANAESKADELQRKIADIDLLKDQLSDRKKQAEAVLNELLTQQQTLADEIRLIQKSYEFKSYQQVQEFDRARHNIELLRTITSYIEAFTRKIRFYQTGHDKLTYLHQSAEDDIKMISTLNDFEIDALTTQISLVINRYLREAHIIRIDPEKIELVSPEKIWKRIVKGDI